jgi:DNA repair exonuclease SbcCD ATPase subunit
MSDLDTMSKDELLEVIDDLNRDLEERESTIQALEQEKTVLRRGGSRGGRDDDYDEAENILQQAANETEMENLRTKLDEYDTKFAEQRDKINELSSHLKAVEAEKLESEADCRRLRKKADDLESQFTLVQDSTRTSLRTSQDIKRREKDTQKHQLQLFQENERLQDEVRDLSLSLPSLLYYTVYICYVYDAD